MCMCFRTFHNLTLSQWLVTRWCEIASKLSSASVTSKKQVCVFRGVYGLLLLLLLFLFLVVALVLTVPVPHGQIQYVVTGHALITQARTPPKKTVQQQYKRGSNLRRKKITPRTTVTFARSKCKAFSLEALRAHDCDDRVRSRDSNRCNFKSITWV